MDKPLIKQKETNSRALTTGTIARYLRKDLDFANKVCALGFSPEMIAKDAYVVTQGRDTAAHKPICERAVAEDLRRLILRPDGILSRLHPSVSSESKAGGAPGLG